MRIIQLKNPELLTVTDEQGARTVGGDQYWYPKEGFIPPGACGATTASNVLAYLLRSRPELYAAAERVGLSGLAPPGGENGKDGYLDFMKSVYRYLYPRVGGLMADVFVSGMDELAAAYELPVEVERLKMPIGRMKRPSFRKTADFLIASLEEDLPVAFLILSNGCVENLDTWHWVTILAFDTDRRRAQIADNGAVFWADLATWLNTSIMGGSLVRLRISGERSAGI